MSNKQHDEFLEAIKNSCNHHDHTESGECLVVEWKGAVEEHKEALAHKMMDAKEEQAYIKKINSENKKMVNERLKKENVQPF